MGIPLNVTPKCLREVVMGTDFPLKEKSRISGKLRLEKILISVLSGLNDILLNQLNKFPVIPYAFILCKRLWCQTLSNALERSQNTKQFASFFCNEFKMQL